MRVFRYFRDNIVGRLALLSFALVLFLTFVAQVLIHFSYQESLEARMMEMTTETLTLQAQSLYALVKPYMTELYSAATDETVYGLAASSGAPNASGRFGRLNTLFRDRISNGHAVQALGILYADGSDVFYEKYDQRSNFWLSASAGERMDLYHKALAADHPVSTVDESDLDLRRLVYVAVPLMGTSINPRDADRVIVASISLSFLENVMQEMDTDSARNYLVDSDGRVIMCAQQDFAGQSVGEAASAGGNITVIDAKVNTVGWRLFKRIDRDLFIADLAGRNWASSIIYIALAFLVAAFCVLLAYKALRPVRIMAAAMNEAGGGNLAVRAKVEGRDELWNSVLNFNKMMRQLEGYYETNKRYYQKIIDTERRHRSAELATLESHINAHFLFNTLNAISYQALDAGNREVSTSIKRLANMMRYAFNGRQQNVRLYQEAAWVEQYLSIQKDRLGKKLDYEVEVGEDVADWPMRKMMLQPFVENAVIHGLSGTDGGLILLKAGKAADGSLSIVISDNGRGMPPETYQKVDAILRNPQEATAGGIGLSNVAERIYSFYGPGAEITLETEEGKGSAFHIKLPWPNEKQLAAGFVRQDEENDYEVH
jgi:signal transduction histidine kinase